MINDKGFSQIISVVVVIIIILLIGVVITISSRDGEQMKTVDIMTTEMDDEEEKPSIGIVNFAGLDLSAGGYKVVKQELYKDIQVLSEIVEGKYTILTQNIHQDDVFLIKDFWQDKETGGQDLFELSLETGDIREVFTLPNIKVGDRSKFITGAVYSADRERIAYSTNLYSEESLELLEGGSEAIEIWEYDTIKDMHTLIANVNGGLYSGLKVLGYDALQESLVLYQFNADAGASVLGRIQFLSIAEGVIDKESFQLALDKHFSQEDKEDKVKTAGYPYLSPSGKYIAFVLPSMTYGEDLHGNNNEVVLYDIQSHSLKSIYTDDLSALSTPSLNNLYWVDNDLYIPTSSKLIMYSVEASKAIPIYVWSKQSPSYILYDVTNNGVIIGSGDKTPIYIDFNEAGEVELMDMINYEYINIYYK
ncbi:hypothetical protein ISR92_02585 [Patescibacteria group bacterium]|nr:hypothetical protein [Patescibacteria group bacterium]